MPNKDFLINLFIVLFDIITILILGYIFITNILSIVGLCALLFLCFRVRQLINNLYFLVCENYENH